MYYLRDGLAKQDKKGLGAVLAALFAIACIGGSFGGGNMVQINQATSQLIATGGREDYFEACGHLGRPTVTICTRIFGRKKKFRGGAKNAPGRVLDRFWDPPKFFKIL